MDIQALNHLVDAARSLSRNSLIRVFGSSSLLVLFSDLGGVGGPLEFSYDADLLLQPTDESQSAM
ncbi:MAG: hypothetical protein PHD76_08060 [Methylacidiphilales bacterium]|nr:hypothetical protein [Candidatus Methylacidiphilales bacterium]